MLFVYKFSKSYFHMNKIMPMLVQERGGALDEIGFILASPNCLAGVG